MKKPEPKPHGTTTRIFTSSGFDMETLVGSILLIGVLLSVALLISGSIWNWVSTGQLQVNYPIVGMNLFTFLTTELRQATSGQVRPQLMISMGITALMLTPFTRVFVSMLYFALVERNLKYMLFTCFVLGVLTYSLFLR